MHAILKRVIRQAQARDMVMRNVAELVETPKGTAGRPSRALTLDRAPGRFGGGTVIAIARLRRGRPADRRPHRGSPRLDRAQLKEKAAGRPIVSVPEKVVPSECRSLCRVARSPRVISWCEWVHAP
ncbi:hypothetical protein GCM10009736_75110 [Actinomadura bangladeshensis]